MERQPRQLSIVGQEPVKPDDSGWTGAFDSEFWPAYPRRRGVSKFMARKAWDRIRPQTQEMLDEVCNGLDRWKAYWQEKETEETFIPHPATWLNQHRWEDET